MRGVKKLDIYLLKNFLGLFMATFFIAIFILLMQFVWMHVKDLVGKGVEISVLAEFFIPLTQFQTPFLKKKISKSFAFGLMIYG